MKKLIYFIIFCALVSCNEKKRKTSQALTDGLIEIDMYKEYPQKDIFIQDVADVEYIPLETRSDVLLDRIALNKICMSDSLIITDNSEGTVFIFNRQGKNISSFNHLGRSGEEYLIIHKMAVDFIRREIYVSDNMQKICVYDFEGSFKRVLKLPSGYNFMFHLFNYDQESLLICCSSAIKLSKYLTKEIDKQPYLLISKEDGRIIPLGLTFQERVLSVMLAHEPDGGMIFYEMPLASIMKNGNEFLIADYGIDTIYRLEGTTLTPCFLKSPSHTWKKEIPIMGWVTFKTDRYTFFCFMDLLLNGQFSKQLVYDQQTGEIFEYKLMNRDYQPAERFFFDFLHERDLPSGYVRFKLLPTELKNDYQVGKLSGKLKEITATLDEDANPVLMLVKFRN